VSIHKRPFSPISASGSKILILEILQCIPAVKIFAFLDLEENCLFMDGHEIRNKERFEELRFEL